MPVREICLGPRQPSCEQTEFKFIRAGGNWTRLTKRALYRVWRCTSILTFSIKWSDYFRLRQAAVARDPVGREIDELVAEFSALSLDDDAAQLEDAASSVGTLL